jgi:hypothetical protein
MMYILGTTKRRRMKRHGGRIRRGRRRRRMEEDGIIAKEREVSTKVRRVGSRDD